MKKSFFFKRTINQSSEFNWQVGGEMRAIKREMKLICILHVGSLASGVRGNMKSAKLDPTQQQQNQKKSDIRLSVYKIQQGLNRTGSALFTCLLHHKKVARIAVARRAQLLGVHFLLPLNKNLSKIAANSETKAKKKKTEKKRLPKLNTRSSMLSVLGNSLIVTIDIHIVDLTT